MRTTGSYRQGNERFLPSPAELVILVALVLFCWHLYGGRSNDAIAGLSTVVLVAIAWVIGFALRAGLNDMRWWLGVAALMALLAPWMALNTFQIGLMTQTMVFVLVILGLNVVTGLTGQISLGHGALVGISAYATAILTDHWGWPLLPAMLTAIGITFAFGFALGIPALRLAGSYLAIATLAAALVFPLFLKLDSLDSYTGGVQGLRLEEPPNPPGPLGDFLRNENISKLPEAKKFATPTVQANERARWARDTYIYFLTVIPAALGAFGVWNLSRSRFGRAFVAVRDSEVAATSMGINAPLYKVTAFGISALYAGIAGALFYMSVAFVAPESFDLINLSINPLAYMVIGGLATTGGSLIGAFGYRWVPEIIAKIARTDADFDRLQGALTGLILIVVMTRMPQGIWGTLVRVNRLSWARLSDNVATWATTRSLLFWIGAGAGAAATILAGILAGPIWAVFAAGLLVVAPADAWTQIGERLRGLPLLHRARRDESLRADVT